VQVGQSFAAGLNDAMAPCLARGGSAASCCTIIQQVCPLTLSIINSGLFAIWKEIFVLDCVTEPLTALLTCLI
jgi:hypothetical protein